MVWAILRIAPKREYLEFDAHPASRIVYTLNLDRQRKNKMPKGRKRDGN